MSKSKYNPLTEYTKNGKRIRLHDVIKEDVETICLHYIEKYGMKPSKKEIESWMKREKQAYHKCETTRTS